MEIRVSLSSYPVRGGKRQYHARWYCPVTHKRRSEKVGTCKRKAQERRYDLERKLNAGEWHDVRDVTWLEFVEDHTAKIAGKANRTECKRVLDEFGTVCSPACPKHITYSMLERYRAALQDRNLSPASVNKSLRYMRAALNAAVKRGNAGRSPFDGSLFVPENHAEPRVVSPAEESALKAAATDLYGQIWTAFIEIALQTAARRGELLRLRWQNADLDGASILLTETKGRRDRRVPLTPESVATLQRLKAKTLRSGGPFVELQHNAGREWNEIRTAAKLPDVSIHDLRRTALTRMALCSVPMSVLQRIAGHAAISTTATFYIGLGSDDLRQAVNTVRLTWNRHESAAAGNATANA